MTPPTASTATGDSSLGEVEAALARYGRLARGRMERFLPSSGSGVKGDLARLLRDYPTRGGKSIRPALVMAACEAWGGTARDALSPAAAIELLHNAFLIHDDLQDESELRRGRPTLHRIHGAALAVNAGDALAVAALASLSDHHELGSRLSQRVMAEILQMARQTTEGQHLELRWRRDNERRLRPSDYFDLILKKTCCYTTIYPLRIGALVGSQGTIDAQTLEQLGRFGFYLGAAFQIRDDLLNLVGQEERYGKEVLGDLREGKRTLMLIHLLDAIDGADQEWLNSFLARPIGSRQPEEARRLLALMEHYGSLDFANTWGRAIATAAHEAFDQAFGDVPAGTARSFIRDLIPYMLTRTS